MSSRSQWALPDLNREVLPDFNRELQISVGTAKHQPRAPDLSGLDKIGAGWNAEKNADYFTSSDSHHGISRHSVL